MSIRPAPRARRRVALRSSLVVLVVGLLAAALGACGVPTESAPEPLDSALVNQPPPPSDTGTGASLFFVRDGRLVPVSRAMPTDDRAHLLVLLTGVSEREAAAGLRSAIPATVRLRDVRRSGPQVTVDLSGDLGEASAEEQTLALAQIVFTATETGARAVRLLVDGMTVQVPHADGTLDSSELGRSDFQAQAPLTAQPRAAPSAPGSD